MKLTDVQTVVWDLDGTLINSFELFQEILADVLQDFVYDPPSRETMLHNFHGSLEQAIGNALDVKGAELTEIAQAFLRVQERHYKEIEHLVYADASGLAQRAHEKGIRQIIVTNREHKERGDASPVSIVRRSDFTDYIDTIISGDDSAYRKPDARTIEGRGAAGNVVVIGDQFVDAEFARNLGGRAVLINRHIEDIAHLERLGENWQDFVKIVKSLDEVELG